MKLLLDQIHVRPNLEQCEAALKERFAGIGERKHTVAVSKPAGVNAALF